VCHAPARAMRNYLPSAAPQFLVELSIDPVADRLGVR
jgi:hypothetical protein